MINLPQVTLLSIIWDNSLEHLERTLRVLRYMNGLAVLHDTMLITACRPPAFFDSEKGVKVLQIPPLDGAGFNIFLLKVMPFFVTGDYVMLVQDDGFILDPAKWENEFLDNDFIGAPWENGLVGNEGFCIQSRKLLEFKLRMPWVDTESADVFICQQRRFETRSAGLKFAPTDLAARFSTETTHKGEPSFGFHGRAHAADKYKLAWERLEAWENGQ